MSISLEPFGGVAIPLVGPFNIAVPENNYKIAAMLTVDELTHELIGLSDSGWDGAATQLATQIDRWIFQNLTSGWLVAP